MQVIIDTDTMTIVGYSNQGRIQADTDNNQILINSTTKPSPLNQYEAYDSDGWKVRKKSTDVINTEAAELKWEQVRAERNKLLKKSDGMYLRQLNENTLDDYHSNLLNQYRQDLRDVPEQTNPFSITWPTWPL